MYLSGRDELRTIRQARCHSVPCRTLAALIRSSELLPSLGVNPTRLTLGVEKEASTGEVLDR